jgi:hypothetical protein
MQLTSVLLTALAFALGANACAMYKDCKCHDTATGLQNNAITSQACTYYGGNAHYNDHPHHQVRLLLLLVMNLIACMAITSDILRSNKTVPQLECKHR